jgi:iron-regulated transporter 1
MSTQSKILLSRFFTRFGDQAWDFAVPLVLIQLFPGKIQLISFLYLFSKIIQIFFGPSFQRKIDHSTRLSIYKIGIGYQTLAMAFMWIFISALFLTKMEESFFNYLVIFISFGALSSIANLGSSLMDTAVGFDLAIDVLPEEELTLFNSRLKRLDLLTEVTSPIFTGLILSFFSGKSEFYGFSIVAILNLLTFLPEYLLLKSIPNINQGKILKIKSANNEPGFATLLKNSFVELKEKPYTPVIISYALLWLSILSPHGVLLTSYLKDGAHVSELIIGAFRGLGAIFGLIPTFLYPILKNKYGTTRTSKLFLLSQFIFVTLAGISFYIFDNNILPFLIFILFSRIGLYGFSIGETELRQHLIPKKMRGEINGIANSITSFATLLLFFMGTIFGDIKTFGIMIVISIDAVGLGLLKSLGIKKV